MTYRIIPMASSEIQLIKKNLTTPQFVLSFPNKPCGGPTGLVVFDAIHKNATGTFDKVINYFTTFLSN